MVYSSSPRYGEKASYYSAVCLETGEVEWRELEGNSNSGTSAAFLGQLRERHSGRLNVIWDNAPAHRGEAVREYLRTPGLNLRLFNLPGYSPDFNADEAVWGWVREEATGNLCLGDQGQGAGTGRQLPRWSGQPERGGKTPLPHRLAIKGRRPARATPTPTLNTPEVHIRPWLWFRTSKTTAPTAFGGRVAGPPGSRRIWREQRGLGDDGTGFREMLSVVAKI